MWLGCRRRGILKVMQPLERPKKEMGSVILGLIFLVFSWWDKTVVLWNCGL
jgi:hypothetical protein